MDSSDSLKLDENLARFLAAYDQELDGGDGRAPTVHVPYPPLNSPSITTERPVTPLNPQASNEGSLSELLPDPQRTARIRPPTTVPLNGTHRIARFELRRQLGKGGCGIVFLAYDPRMQREVALKVPRPEMLMNPDAKRRLKLEALAASEFDHPNLVPVYEWGELGPVCFIATAFCPGQTLAEWIDRQAFPVPVRQAARLVSTVADAVQHAHDRGVLHRDLKPNNVILQEMKVEENDEPPAGSVQLRGEHYVPRIVDFGLAKLAERGGPSETGTRQILGTPKYMAPEQAQARREDIGPPADVYALGVVLYELLAGRAPYDGASDVEVLRQSVEGRPIPPRHLRPDIPRDLEAICLKAMARTTTERYRTAIDFADDLRRFLDGRPTVARPLAWAGRAVRWLRRNDQIVAIVVLIVTVLFLTFLGMWNTYTARNLKIDHDKVLNDQAVRNRAEQEREYVRQVRDAFHAWRSGNPKAAAESLEAARRSAGAVMDAPEFAHDYLTRLSGTGPFMIVCPAGPVTALAVSPDGTRLASGHADGTVTVWDRATGARLGSVQAHDGDVTHIGFALGGKLLVSVGSKAGANGAMLGWSVDPAGAVGAAKEPHRAFGNGTTCMIVAPDGNALFAGDSGGAVRRLNLSGAAPTRAIQVTEGDYPTALGASPNGQRIVIGTAQGRVSGFSAELADGTPEQRANGTITAVAVRADGSYDLGFRAGGVVTGAGLSGLRAVETGEPVYWLATSPHGFAANSVPGRVRLGRSAELATGDAGTVRAGAFAPDGNTLFTAGSDGIIRGWNLPADVRDRATATVGRVTALGAFPGGRPREGDILVGTDAGLHKFDNGQSVGAGANSGRTFRAIQLNENGTRRGVVFERCDVVIGSVTDAWEVRFRVRVPDDRSPVAVALTPDGARIAIGDDLGGVTVWSVADRKELARIKTGTRRPVGAVAFSDDGRFVATHVATGVGVWAIDTSEAVAALVTDERAVFRFLPTGNRIAIAGRDGVVRLFNSAWREEQTLFGHVGRVTGLGVSPDGRTLVSGGATGEVKFWDLKAGQELYGLRRHSVPVTRIEFALDGRALVTAGDGEVALWDSRE